MYNKERQSRCLCGFGFNVSLCSAASSCMNPTETDSSRIIHTLLWISLQKSINNPSEGEKWPVILEETHTPFMSDGVQFIDELGRT